MIFLCYPKCSTCQKAKKWLEENKIDFTDSNISGIAIDLNSLKGMIINMYQCKIIADIFGVEVSD